MGRRKKNFFTESLKNNVEAYYQYIDRLTELSISMFEWKNVPEAIDTRFLELTLFTDGQAIFFYDESMKDYLALQMVPNGRLDIYRIPIQRRAFAVNGYQKTLNRSDSVIIWNNLLHKNSILPVEMYARRLYNYDRIIDVNANAQKTPVLLQCDEEQRLTLLNLYKEIDGNAPVIFGSKNLDLNAIKSINSMAPYISDKIYELKINTWNEALTYLGISNITTNKKERLITDEVNRSLGGTIASRYSRLEARQTACEQINKMFGLNIECKYRADFIESDEEEKVGDSDE